MIWLISVSTRMITTLQKLRDRPVERSEAELQKLISRKRKMVLLLPALVTEFDGQAMPRIIEELKEVSLSPQDRALPGPGHRDGSSGR